MAKALRIGELSRLTGRTVHAIRWYEAQGLMPGVARDTAGRRVYNARHVSWLELLDRLRRTGMSVAELRAYTALALRGSGATRETRDMLVAHRARVKDAIAEWNSALKLVDAKIGYYSQWIASGERPKPEAADHRGAQLPQSGKRPPRSRAR